MGVCLITLLSVQHNRKPSGCVCNTSNTATYLFWRYSFQQSTIPFPRYISANFSKSFLFSLSMLAILFWSSCARDANFVISCFRAFLKRHFTGLVSCHIPLPLSIIPMHISFITSYSHLPNSAVPSITSKATVLSYILAQLPPSLHSF